MTGTPTRERLEHLERKRADLRTTCEAMLLEKRAQNVEELTGPDAIKFRAMAAYLHTLDETVKEYRADLERVGHIPISSGGSTGAMGYGRVWAEMTAEKLSRSMGGGLEKRVVVSGSIDIPQFIEPDVIPMARPVRLIDIFPNRLALEGNAFEYFVQSVRTNNATAVADGAVKPTSVLTSPRTPIVAGSSRT